MDLTISIVNTNNKYYIGKCLRSLRLMERDGYMMEIFVVDNCSTDGSQEAIRNGFPEVNLIENKERLGFSSNHNQVIKRAKGRYILVLNDDTEMPPDTIRNVIHYMDLHPDIGISGCKTYLGNGDVQKTCGRYPTFWGEYISLTFQQMVPFNSSYIKWRMMHDFSYDETRDVDWISGVFLFLRKEVIEKIGILDENFFIYYEDVEYCHRVRQMTSYKVTYIPDVSILHYHGKTMSGKKANYKGFVNSVHSFIYYLSKVYSNKTGTRFKVMVVVTHHLLIIIAFLVGLLTLFSFRPIRNYIHKNYAVIKSYYTDRRIRASVRKA